MVTPHVHPRDPGQKLSSLIHLDAFAALDDGAVDPVTKPATAQLVSNVRGWDFKPRKKPGALTVQQYRSGLLRPPKCESLRAVSVGFGSDCALPATASLLQPKPNTSHK